MIITNIKPAAMCCFSLCFIHTILYFFILKDLFSFFLQGLRIKDYTLEEEIGRGGFGIVYKAINRSDGRHYAIKRILIDVDRNQTSDEMKVVKKLSEHENVVTVRDFFFHPTKPKVFFSMEYCDGGDLEKYIIKHEPKLKESFDYMGDITNGLAHLHSEHVIHRDLKPQNILLVKSGPRYICKISDFGISKVGMNSKNYFMTKCGTIGFMAPEVLDMFQYTYSADIFSLALIFYVLKTQMVHEQDGKKLLLPVMTLQKRPCPVSTVVRRKEMVKDTFIKEGFPECELLGNLVLDMLSYDHHGRPAIDDVMVRLAEAKGSYGSGPAKQDPFGVSEVLKHLLLGQLLADMGITIKGGQMEEDTFEGDAVDGVIQVRNLLQKG